LGTIVNLSKKKYRKEKDLTGMKGMEEMKKKDLFFISSISFIPVLFWGLNWVYIGAV
jgi:hypothetical protein